MDKRGRGGNRFANRAQGFKYSGRGGRKDIKVKQEPEQNPEISSNQQQSEQQRGQVTVYKKTKKYDPQEQVKSIDLKTYFRNWIETDRKNIIINFNEHFDELFISTFEVKIEDIIEAFFNSNRDVRKHTLIFKGGMYLAVALRMIYSASSSQLANDYLIQEFSNNVREYKIPNSFNLILEQVGKFTDPSFGNARIAGPLIIAKRKIIQSMSMMYHAGYRDWISQPKKSSELEKYLKGDLNIGDIISGDKDSISYIKERSEVIFDFLDKANLSSKGEKGFDWRIPYYNRDDKSQSNVNKYINSIKYIDSNFDDFEDLGKFPWLKGKKVREVIGALVILNIISTGFMDSDDNLTGDYFPGLKNTWLENESWKNIKIFTNLVQIDELMSTKHIVTNALECEKIYQERGVSLLEKEIRLTALTKSEFGSISQLIEPDEESSTLKPGYRAISTFSEENKVVLGGLINYCNRVKFKRSIFGNLSTTRKNIMKSLILSDHKK